MIKRIHSDLFYASDLDKTADFYKQLGFDAPSWKSMAQLLNAALVLLVLAGAGLYALAGRRTADPWLALLQAARDKALQAGLRLAKNASPKDIAQALPADWPNRTAASVWLMQLEQIRYSHHARQPHPSKHLATLKRSFKSHF